MERLLAAMAIAIVLQGCAATDYVKAAFRVDEALGFGNTTEEIGGCKSEDNGGNIGSIHPINLTCFNFPGTSKNAYEAVLACSRSAAAAAANSPAEKACRVLRNELQSLVMRRSNAICDQHKGDILANAAVTNVGLGVGGVITSALGAALVGTRAKTNLAAATAVLTGTQAHINQEFYQKQFAGTIITAINTSRAGQKTEIDQKRRQPLGDYSIDDALIDAQDYHYRCSFYHGVAQVTKAVDRQDANSRAKLTERIEALRTEYDKTDKMSATTDADKADKARMLAALRAQIEGLQQLLKAAVD